MCDLGMKFSWQSSLSGKSKLFEGHVKPCVWLPTAKRLMILCSTLTVLLTLSHGGRPCITDDNFMNLNGVLGAGWMQWWCASRACTASGRVQGLSAMTLTADPPTASFSPRTTWPPSSWSVPTHAFAPLSPHVIPVQLPAEPRASEMCLQTHKRAAGACGCCCLSVRLLGTSFTFLTRLHSVLLHALHVRKLGIAHSDCAESQAQWS